MADGGESLNDDERNRVYDRERDNFFLGFINNDYEYDDSGSKFECLIDEDNNVVVAEGTIDGMNINKEDTNTNIDHNWGRESTPRRVNPSIAAIGISKILN